MEVNDQDKKAFAEILEPVFSTYNKTTDAQTLKLWFALMQKYDIQTFKKAIYSHLTDSESGRFMPTPAHIIAQIEKTSNKNKQLSSDEAWAIALQALDERNTVVWNDAISEAFAIAKDVLPDRVGARMAFKNAYERILNSLESHDKLKWYPSIGTCKETRQEALNRAVEVGRLKSEYVAGLLPAPVSVNKELAAVYLEKLKLITSRKEEK